jgi:hypothetical protein
MADEQRSKTRVIQKGGKRGTAAFERRGANLNHPKATNWGSFPRKVSPSNKMAELSHRFKSVGMQKMPETRLGGP